MRTQRDSSTGTYVYVCMYVNIRPYFYICTYIDRHSYPSAYLVALAHKKKRKNVRPIYIIADIRVER